MADITVSVSSPGILGFGQDNFGAQNFGGENLSATTSIGISQFINNTGWGANEWGLLGWGVNYENGDASLTGSQLNISEGNVTAEGEIREGWGVYQWGIVPWGGQQDPIVNVVGTALTVVTHPVDINADGNESVSVDEDDDIIIYLNNVTPTGDANVSVTGSRLNISEGLASVFVRIDVDVPVTGLQLNTAVGQVVGGTIQEVSVTGSQINIAIGNEIPNADANVNVTGSRINLTPGQVTYAAGYDVSGSRINVLTGQTNVTGNAVVNVTGSRLNISTGSASIIAWAEVQTGASNIWTPVDLAA